VFFRVFKSEIFNLQSEIGSILHSDFSVLTSREA
jgi:hypothetical protein